MVLKIGGKWSYSCCFMKCCFLDLFSKVHSIFVQFLSSFFSVNVVHPFNSIDTNAAWMKFRFNLSGRSDFHMIDSLSIGVHAFTRGILTSLSLDEMLLPKYVNMSTTFREPPF